MYTRARGLSRELPLQIEVSSAQSCRNAKRLRVGGQAGAQVFEAGRVRQRHPIGAEAPRRVDRDHADQPAIALAAVDQPRAVLGLLEQLEALCSPGQAQSLDLGVVLIRPEVRRLVVGLALLRRQQDVAAGLLALLGR